jgi:hypothetical protein
MTATAKFILGGLLCNSAPCRGTTRAHDRAIAFFNLERVPFRGQAFGISDLDGEILEMRIRLSAVQIRNSERLTPGFDTPV